MKIVRVLKLYRYKKADLVTSLARIKTFKQILKTNDFELFCRLKSQDIGIPKSKRISSPVEAAALKKERSREMTAALVNEIIKQQQRRTYILSIEIEQIEAALDALTYQDKQIIIWKYMDDLDWREVEINFYETYKKPLIDESLRKRATFALDVLTRILKPFYDNFTT